MADARFSEDFWTDLNGKVWKVISPKTRPFKEKYKSRSAVLRDFVFNRDNHECQICGRNNWLCLDHKIPLRFGGSNHPNNLQCLCHSCNSKKVKKDREIFGAK